MEQRRIFLVILLALVGLLLWNNWQKDFPTPKEVPINQEQAQPSVQSSGNPAAVQNTPLPSNASMALQKVGASPANRTIHVRTDVLDVTIDTLGGDIMKVALPKFPLTPKDPNVPYVLLNDQPATRYIAPSRLIGTLGGKAAQGPVQYQVAQRDYTLADGQNKIDVALTYQDPHGLIVTKTYAFTRGKYTIGVNYAVDNHSQQTWNGHLSAQISRIPVEPPKSMFVISSGLYAAYSTSQKAYEKLKFNNLKKTSLDQTTNDGWIAMTQRYFLSAWIPSTGQSHQFYTRAEGDLYTIGFTGPNLTAPPQGQVAASATFYAGPEDTDILKTVAPHLDLTIDYGWLWFISMALFWLMNEIYKVVGNWGWSIILVTVVVKALFYQLSAKSYRSMAKMRVLQPKMEALKERYGDDKQKISQATMELYRKEKVNPVSGCLPMLVQIPVFIALYWVLIDSVQLRQAPFILWIHDLSVMDPYYILPIIMGLTMYLQTFLNPPSPDPTMNKVTKLMPVMFTFFFLHFPSGLVLYWIVNNVLSILQQWYIMRKYSQNVPVHSHKSKKKK